MLRLGKVVLSLALAGAFVWFALSVKLGSRTLFEHLAAIARSRESQELVRGTKKTAEPLIEDVKRKVASRSEKPAAPAESISDRDREDLRRVIRESATR